MLSPELLVLIKDRLHVEPEALQRLAHARSVCACSRDPSAAAALVSPANGS